MKRKIFSAVVAALILGCVACAAPNETEAKPKERFKVLSEENVGGDSYTIVQDQESKCRYLKVVGYHETSITPLLRSAERVDCSQ